MDGRRPSNEVGRLGEAALPILDGKPVAKISPSLTAGSDAREAAPFTPSLGISFMGITPAGPFGLPFDQVRDWLAEPRTPTDARTTTCSAPTSTARTSTSARADSGRSISPGSDRKTLRSTKNRSPTSTPMSARNAVTREGIRVPLHADDVFRDVPVSVGPPAGGRSGVPPLGRRSQAARCRFYGGSHLRAASAPREDFRSRPRARRPPHPLAEPARVDARGDPGIPRHPADFFQVKRRVSGIAAERLAFAHKGSRASRGLWNFTRRGLLPP